MEQQFLPLSRKDMEARGLSQLDFVYVSGDAYVDHPSFGSAIITRLLESRGYTVGLICQPDWRNEESICEYGEPRLGFLVSSGNMDSMVNHYTVAKKRRGKDAYSPGGANDRRPDRAVTVYCNLIRRKYKKTPIVIGGLEASLRRMSHYDYWSDSVRRSVLLESGADLVSYGMGEHSIVEIADALASGLRVEDITFISGTVFKTRNPDLLYDAVELPAYEEVLESKEAYARSFAMQYRNTDPFQGKRLYETYGGKTYVVQNPPAKPLDMMEMDDVYALPYMRAYHPSYEAAGGIPALQEIKFSLTSNRGCYGECNFCALTMHEGRIVQARSQESIIEEAQIMTDDPAFKGYIHDVGGPTAEFRKPACRKQMTKGACIGKRCLFPTPCKNLEVDHKDYLQLLRRLRKLPKVKKVFVRSGFRFDYLLADKNREFLRELCEYHVSGQLRVAPEHVSDPVLEKMGKPASAVYRAFEKEYEKVNKSLKKEQYLVPYLMSSHPGSTLADAIKLAEYLKTLHFMPEQVQDFYPTPGTVSTCMYYTGLDPFTLKPVYVARDPHEKAMQRALIQFKDPKNYELVKEALQIEGREDLIGFGQECLIPPRKIVRRAGKPVKVHHEEAAASTENRQPRQDRRRPSDTRGNTDRSGSHEGRRQPHAGHDHRNNTRTKSGSGRGGRRR
ncbi:MAG: YgiQ family radical SAM protein [Lachnospiraceae bacterium]|nr:YgiQ family radical SAM protein [Lachnospiraceae bacterium]